MVGWPGVVLRWTNPEKTVFPIAATHLALYDADMFR